ncbi:MAG TPA: NirA family protein, partial [Verrucomicrobiae bacterium]
MSTVSDAMTVAPSTVEPSDAFTSEQKEYLAGFLAALAQRNLTPYVGTTGEGKITADPGLGGENLAEKKEEMIFGTPLGEATKQERWKHEEHPLDGWDRILVHAEADKFPDEENTYRFRNFGLFYVAPAQNSFMLRCRIPAGELTAAQLKGLADIADQFGNGKAAITTRSNIQIREIASRNLVNVLTRLQSLGLTARGSGVDNVRNITASPTAGFDPQELIDTRAFAHALHHYILNHRDLYGLPRKFNVAFEGGGSVDTVADTNDLGFMAVTVPAAGNTHHRQGTSLRDGSSVLVEPGVYFRLELAGITGHKQMATDAGILVKPSEVVGVAV